MKHIPTILLLVFAINTNAQKIRFTDSTNHWTTLSLRGGDLCSFQNTFSYGADTTVSGISYRYMRESSSLFIPGSCMGSGFCMGGGADSFNYLVREDTTSGIVYYINPFDTLEHLLFNYNLNVGDSITYLFPSNSFTDSVASIDSTLINGIYHKIFNMQNKGNPTGRNYTILEGIGCTNSPTFPAWFPGCFEYTESLVCFSEHGTYPTASAPINSCAAYSSYPCSYLFIPSFHNIAGCVGALATSNAKKQTPFLTITPNPATDHIDITSEHPFAQNTFVTVYDMSGRSVFRTQAEQKSSVTINTSEWRIDGLYMIIIQDNSGIIKKEKMVVQH